MKMLSCGLATILSACLLSSQATSGSPIAAGDLVVLRVGDGNTVATGAGLPVSLLDYKITYTGVVPTSLTLQQTIDLPTATSGTAPTSGDRWLVQGGTAGGEGGLFLSTNGQYMTLVGYNRPIGGTLNGSGSDTEDRVVGRLDLNTGVVDTTTTLVPGAATAAVRSAFTTNGTDLWVAFSNGVRFATYGTANTGYGTSLAGTNNARREVIYKGQLYQTEAATSRSGVETIGSGTPKTASTNAPVLLTGFSTTNTTYSPYDFFFADDNTLYIADDGASSSTAPGLQKWTQSGGAWTKVYNHPIATHSNSGIKGLSGYVDPDGNVIMFASTTGANGNFLMSLTDTLSNSLAASVTENTLAQGSDFGGAGNWNFRGVAWNVPEPSALALFTIAGTTLLRRRLFR
jgi:hypothetical protein